jgi:hypothetical protein
MDKHIETHFLFVDSRSRDSTAFVSPTQYVVQFDNVLKNVVCVELVYALYGRSSGNDTYVNLHIEELDQDIITQPKTRKVAFTQLPFFEAINDKYEYSQQKYRSIRRFSKPLVELDRLSITFTRDDGTFFPVTEHLLRFEITCIEQMKHAVVEELGDIDIRAVNITQPKNPYIILGLDNGVNNIDTLISAFKKKSLQLRNDGFSNSAYEELKNAFASVAKTLNRIKQR